MHKRLRLYGILVTSLCLIAFGLGMWVHVSKQAYVRHEPIDTHNLARFLGCYAHHFTIPKKALKPYTKCELQVVHRDGRIVPIGGADPIGRNDDGDFEVIVMLKPKDTTKTFKDAPMLDYYFNGMGSSIDNPFFGLLQNKGISYVRDGQIRNDTLRLFEFDGRPTPTEDVVRVIIRLQFS